MSTEKLLIKFVADYFKFFGTDKKVEDKKHQEKNDDDEEFFNDAIPETYNSYNDLLTLIFNKKMDIIVFRGDTRNQKRLDTIKSLWITAVLRVFELCSIEITLDHGEQILKIMKDAQKKHQQ